MAESTEELNRNGDRRGMSPQSRENLEKGRRNGRGKKKDNTITSTARGMLDELCPERWLHIDDKGKGLTWRQAIAKSLLAHAVMGKQGAISELLDRLEGKVTQPIGGEGGGPVILKVVYDDSD